MTDFLCSFWGERRRSGRSFEVNVHCIRVFVTCFVVENTYVF